MKKNIKTLTHPITEEAIHPVTFADGVYLNNGTRLEDNLRYLRSKSLDIGDLNKLQTNNKHSLVNAINEIISKKYSYEYGVRFIGSNPNGERIGDSVGLTAVANFEDNNQIIESSFDKIYPWCEMNRCVINDKGVLVAYEGEPGFDTNGILGNVFVEIPKFYQKFEVDETLGHVEYWISSYKNDNYWLNPIFLNENGEEVEKIYIGCYEGTVTGEYLFSRSGSRIVANKTMEEFLRLANNVGPNFSIMSIYEQNLLEYLFMIEFATRNSQSIYKGNCNATPYDTGYTDGLKYHTIALFDSQNVPFKYRGIENLWGNTSTFLNKIKLVNKVAFLDDENTNIELKVDDEDILSTFITDRTLNNNYPYINLPIYNVNNISSNNTYYCDHIRWADSYREEKLITAGGHLTEDYETVGLFSLNINNNLDAASSLITARLTYKE